MEDLIKLNGADKFLQITKLKQVDPDWMKFSEDQKITKLLTAMKDSSFWTNDNVAAAGAIDQETKMVNGTTKSLFSQSAVMPDFLITAATYLKPENDVKISGETGSYSDVSKLIVSFQSSTIFENVRLSSVSLKIDPQTNVQLVDFSVVLNLKSDLRSLGSDQESPTASESTDNPSQPTENVTDNSAGGSTTGGGQ